MSCMVQQELKQQEQPHAPPCPGSNRKITFGNTLQAAWPSDLPILFLQSQARGSERLQLQVPSSGREKGKGGCPARKEQSLCQGLSPSPGCWLPPRFLVFLVSVSLISAVIVVISFLLWDLGFDCICFPRALRCIIIYLDLLFSHIDIHAHKPSSSDLCLICSTYVVLALSFYSNYARVLISLVSFSILNFIAVWFDCGEISILLDY